MADINLTVAQNRKIKSAVKSLNKVRGELQKDNVIAVFDLECSSGGGW